MFLGDTSNRASGFLTLIGKVPRYKLLLVVIGLAVSCREHAAKPQRDDAGVTRVVIAGSTAMLPLVAEAANRFMRKNANIAVSVEAGGSREGIARTLRGEVDIGASDVYADSEAASLLEDHRIAMTGFAAMANRGHFNEQINSLSLDQLRAVFTGRIRDWADLGGRKQPITVINRPKGSGTRAAFGKIVLGKEAFVSGPEQESSALIVTALEQTQGAISYLAFAYQRDTNKAFAVAGVAATNENVANGSYPIWSYEHLYTLGPAAGASKLFIEFMLSVEAQAELIPQNGFAPIASFRGND